MKLRIDHNSNIDQQGKWFELPEHPEFQFLVTPITQAHFRKIRKEYTTIQFDKKTHQKIEVEDPEKRRESLENMVLESVHGWKGVEEKDQKEKMVEAKFSKENFKKLLDRFGNWKLYTKYNEVENENETVTLSSWFMEIALDPANFIEDDTENL
jgi:hypothetical protein